MTEADGPSLTVLEETPARALKFLSAISGNAAIHAALSTRGYADADHEEGWELLFEASGYRRPKAALLGTPASRAAVVAIDAWDEPNFKIIFAALKRRHPDQFLFVSEDLKAATGPAALVSVKTMLDRLDALESGADRKATRKADHAALATLEERGITKEERKRLRDLLATAQTAPVGADVPVVDATKASAKRITSLGAVRAWYDEWSDVAHAVIKRRDWLILLGLAKRKKKGEPPAPAGK